MGEPVPKHTSILFTGVVLTLLALPSCESYQGSLPPGTAQNISGRLVEMPLQTPVAGATVELIANDVDITTPLPDRVCECPVEPCTLRTVTDGEGQWALGNVPLVYNPGTGKPFDFLLRVTAKGYVPSYNLFTLALGNQADLMTLSNLFFLLFSLEAIIGGAHLDEICVMLGPAIAFASTDYPPVSVTLPGVSVQALGGTPPEALPIVYLGESGLPDPELRETSSMGVFYFAVPDARDGAMPYIGLAGTKPGTSLVGGYYPACPGSFVPVALINPYYEP